MALFHRGLSVLLIFISLCLLVVFLLFWGVRHWSEECEVSQVFKLTRAIHLTGDNFIGFYDVAVTPIAPNKTAQTCGLIAVTPARYVNFLDKRVWLLPLEEYQFACDDGPLTRRWNYSFLGISLAAMGLALLLYKGKED